MQCPHCIVAFHDTWTENRIGSDREYFYVILSTTSPTCQRAVFNMRRINPGGSDHSLVMIHPRGVSRAPLSEDVPDTFADGYREACLVLSDSPKASAALSRRCLQFLLRDAVKVKAADLSKEIDEVLAKKTLPPHLAEAIDAVRNIGNFAAHPMKSTNSGEILDVEDGEAEWLLDVLEGLFDFYFVLPAALQKKKDDLNKKLAEAGKPPMK